MEDDDITSDEEIEFKFRRGRHMTLADIQASLDQTSRRRMSALIQRENKKQKEVNTEDTGEDDVDGIVVVCKSHFSVNLFSVLCHRI